MKKIYILIIAIFIGNIANAQWKQSGGPYYGIVRSIAAKDSNIFVNSNDDAYLSTDNGNTWVKVNFVPLSAYTDKISVAFKDSIIFAGIDRVGVYLSTNQGSSWTNLGLNNIHIYTLAISGNNIYVGTDNGVYLSTNNGSTWLMIGLYNTSTNALAVSGNNIFAATLQGLYLSTNNGVSWVAVNSGLPASVQIKTLSISGNNIFAGTAGSGVYLSTNNGNTWIAVNSGLPYNSNILSMATSGSNIFVGLNNTGVYLSTNNGSSWSVKGFVNDRVESIVINGNNIYAGAGGAGIHKSTNNGNSWKSVGMIKCGINSIKISGNNYYLGSNGIGMYMSLNNDSSWFSNGLSTNIVYSFIETGLYNYAGTSNGIFVRINNGNWTVSGLSGYSVYSLAVSGNIIFAATGYGFFCSSDYGSTWVASNTGIIDLDIRSLLVNGSDIFIGTYGGILYKSTNNGNTWIYAGSNDMTWTVSSLAVNGNNLYAGVVSKGVFLSTNNAATWTSVSNGLPAILNNFAPNCFAFIGNNIFVGTTYDGLYLSSNNGSSWIQYNRGLVTPNNNSIYSFAVNGTDLYAGTAFLGVMKLSVIPVNITTQPIAMQSDCTPSTQKYFKIKAIGSDSITYQWRLFKDNYWINLYNGNYYPTGAYYTNVNKDSMTVSGISRAGTYQYRCFVKNFNGAFVDTSDIVTLIIDTIPKNAGIISGNTIVCQGQNSVMYSVPAISYANTYVWNLPSGATGNSTTDTITVNYSSSAVSGNITVKGINTCGNGTPSTLAIIVNPMPSTAGIITGQNSVCPNQSSVSYSIPAINNATSYNWTLPTGATGLSSTNSIIVDYGSNALSGNITVCGNNTCGNGNASALPITVNSIPLAAGSISGSSSVIAGQQNVVYSVPPIVNATSHNWDLPLGTTINYYTGTTISINYSQSATSGNIIVNGNNVCGDGPSSSLYITVNPFVPNCSAQFDLVADTAVLHHYFVVNNASGIPPLQYNWSWGDGTHDTTAYPTHTYSAAGYYNICLSITDSVGCTVTYCDSSYLQKDPNAIVSVQVIPQGTLGINSLSTDKIKIYPNPAKDNLIVELIRNIDLRNNTISFYNIAGQLIKQLSTKQTKTEIDIHDFPAGVYIVKINNEKESFVKKFIKE